MNAGHLVTRLTREMPSQQPASPAQAKKKADSGVDENARLIPANVLDPQSLQKNVFESCTFDAVVSCMASRSGMSDDAWAIDYQAHSNVLKAAKSAGVKHMVLLSAICVQKPRLEFQHAKLAFEKELIESGLMYSIVRPTAFFKSLSGQVERVRNGKPFVVFGDGTLTSCKPISDEDLGSYMAQCIIEPRLQNEVLPIGGPGHAITLREQGDLLFSLTGQPPRFKQVPVGLISGIQTVLQHLGRFSETCANKAELAAIGHYYATESMLVLNKHTGLYDADLTPSTGSQTLADHYAALIEGSVSNDRGQHTVFRN